MTNSLPRGSTPFGRNRPSRRGKLEKQWRCCVIARRTTRRTTANRRRPARKPVTLFMNGDKIGSFSSVTADRIEGLASEHGISQFHVRDGVGGVLTAADFPYRRKGELHIEEYNEGK